MSQHVFLSLGSNIDREHSLVAAVQRLAAAGRLVAVSRAYETKAVGGGGYPDYLNAAVLLETDLDREEFETQVIRRIESQLGRERDPRDKNAPRTIDIDIILWCEDYSAAKGALVSDPDVLVHVHLVAPLAEIAPELIHEASGEALTAVARRLRLAGQTVKMLPDLDLAPPTEG